MKSNFNKSFFALLCLLLTLVVVAVVLINLNNKNKTLLPKNMPLGNVSAIFTSNTIDDMYGLLIINDISNSLKTRIKNYDIMVNTFAAMKADTVNYKKYAGQPCYLTTYTSGQWLIMIDTKYSPKIPGNVFGKNEDGFLTISSSDMKDMEFDINNNFAFLKEKNKIHSLMLAHDVHANVCMMEKLDAEDQDTWVCHDIYIDDELQIISYYNDVKIKSKSLKNNPSPLIKSFAGTNASSRFLNEDNNSVTWITSQYTVTNEPYDPKLSIVSEDVKDNVAIENKSDIAKVIPNKKQNETNTIDNKVALNKDAIYTAETNIIAGPYFVDSHKNDGGILLQTADNYLHYINLAGKVLWKVGLDSPIIGNIDEVDWYNNKKIQYLFNTTTRVYLIDVLGNYVKNFPLILPVKSQNKVAVIENSPSKFAFYYNGIDKAFYYTQFANNDFTIQKKNANIGDVTNQYSIQYDKKTPYIIVVKDDNTMRLYRNTGDLQAKIDDKYKFNPKSQVYTTANNTKGTFVTGTLTGDVVYISKSGAVKEGFDKKFKDKNILTFYENKNKSTKSFYYVKDNELESYDEDGRQIFSNTADVAHPDIVEFRKFGNQLVFTLYSSPENKATIYRYYFNGKLMKNTYDSFTKPTVTDKDVYITDRNFSIIKK